MTRPRTVRWSDRQAPATSLLSVAGLLTDGRRPAPTTGPVRIVSDLTLATTAPRTGGLAPRRRAGVQRGSQRATNAG
jgi:hypothetical protein